MTLSLTQDIRTVTELKRDTKDILDQIHTTGRPIILTVNGKADAVILDVATFERHLQASNMSKLLAVAESDIVAKKTRPMRNFLKDMKNGHKISR